MDTFEKVKSIIASSLNCPEEDITLEATIKEDLGADSLDAVDMIMAFEDDFGISIPPEKAESLVTVNDIVTVINTLV